jgi:hypothetical protein
MKSNSKLNAALAHQFDKSGVKRSFTVPYVDGQSMDEHVSAVGQAAGEAGGLTKNLITTAHHSGGKGYGSAEGHSIGHPSDKLRTTIIPKDDEHAKATIAAASEHLNNLAKLLGDEDPTILTAKGQLKLVQKTDGVGMNLLDFGVMMTQIMFKPTQKAAQMHDATKDGGIHPQMRGSQAQPPQEAQGEPQGAPSGGEAAEAQPAAPAAQGAPAAPAAPPAGAPAAPPAQG